MIISRAEIRSVISAYRAVKRKPSAFDPPDSFDPSAASDALRGLTLATTAEPFYREDLVATLERRITEGRYFVSSEQIVDQLLRRLLAEAAQRA